MKEEKYDKALSCQDQRQGFEPMFTEGVIFRCSAGHKLPLETGLARFGLAYDGVKDRCLTAWL